MVLDGPTTVCAQRAPPDMGRGAPPHELIAAALQGCSCGDDIVDEQHPGRGRAPRPEGLARVDPALAGIECLLRRALAARKGMQHRELQLIG